MGHRKVTMTSLGDLISSIVGKPHVSLAGQDGGIRADAPEADGAESDSATVAGYSRTTGQGAITY
jgi:hypothetical protein